MTGPSGSTPIAEAELELKKGRPRVLFDIARDLQDETGARISVTSKSERGYALLAGAGPAPRRARPPRFPPDATIAQAFQSVARACAEQLLVNQDVLFATHNPEAVHQMRVALRRLISASASSAISWKHPRPKRCARKCAGCKAFSARRAMPKCSWTDISIRFQRKWPANAAIAPCVRISSSAASRPWTPR